MLCTFIKFHNFFEEINIIFKISAHPFIISSLGNLSKKLKCKYIFSGL